MTTMGQSADYWNKAMTPYRLLGLSPGNQSKAAGEALPPTTAAGTDRNAVWYSPDSPTFWLIGFGAATILGLAGLQVRFRAGPVKAEAGAGSA